METANIGKEEALQLRDRFDRMATECECAENALNAGDYDGWEYIQEELAAIWKDIGDILFGTQEGDLGFGSETEIKT